MDLNQSEAYQLESVPERASVPLSPPDDQRADSWQVTVGLPRMVPTASSHHSRRRGFARFRADVPTCDSRRLARQAGREPAMRIATSLLALCCQSGPKPTWDTPISARSRSEASRSLRRSPLLFARFTSSLFAPWMRLREPS